MDAYGLSLQGKFIIETVTSLPDFSEDQVGRFIFVENTEKYWLGGLSSWLSIGLTENTVTSDNISWGSEYGQVNASTIPYTESAYRYIDSDNVQDALLELATGDGLVDECIVTRLIGQEVIKNYNISWGTEDDNVGAKDISLDSVYRGNTGVATIQDAINQIEENCPIIIRKTVQTTAWEVVPADDLYHISVTMIPIDNAYVIVQCYNMSGKQIIPARMITDLSSRKIHIYMPSPIALNVVIVG